jgi:hypothetical protein
LLTLLLGQPPGQQHIAKIAGLALEGTENTVTPRSDVCDIEMIVAELDSYVRVRRQSGDLVQQLVSLHSEVILSSKSRRQSPSVSYSTAPTRTTCHSSPPSPKR